MGSLSFEFETVRTDILSAKSELKTSSETGFTRNRYTTLLARLAAHDKGTALHSTLVGHLSYLLALHMGYSEQKAREIGRATDLHDLGKTTIDSEILNSKNPISNDMKKQHTTFGASLLLKNLQGSFAVLAAEIALYHHEQWNGAGYHGMKSHEIPEIVRLVTICDVFSALIEHRSYRPARSFNEALKIMHDIQFPDGTKEPAVFDPTFFEKFLEIAEKSYKEVQSSLALEAT